MSYNWWSYKVVNYGKLFINIVVNTDDYIQFFTWITSCIGFHYSMLHSYGNSIVNPPQCASSGSSVLLLRILAWCNPYYHLSEHIFQGLHAKRKFLYRWWCCGCFFFVPAGPSASRSCPLLVAFWTVGIVIKKHWRCPCSLLLVLFLLLGPRFLDQSENSCWFLQFSLEFQCSHTSKYLEELL